MEQQMPGRQGLPELEFSKAARKSTTLTGLLISLRGSARCYFTTTSFRVSV